MKIKFNKYFFALISLLLGFSGSVAAQYGVVTNTYRIKGNVMSEKCHQAIPNIKITLRTTDANGTDKDIYSYTNTHGDFVFEMDSYFIDQNEKQLIIVEDIDGDLHSGDYLPTRLQYTNDINDFIKAEYNGNWVQYYDYKKQFHFELKLRKDQPCGE